MPLIWNDERMEFVENSVDFDRTEYVIVRKLFLQFKEHVKNIDEQWIRDAFKEYGNIELVEVFAEGSDTIWAYLTYSNDDEAYRALKEASKLEEIGECVPADTWCQPSSLLSEPIDNDTIVDALNKFPSKEGESQTDVMDLLRKLISFSATSNSELLKEALNTRILPAVKSFDFHLTNLNGTVMTLSETRSIIRSIGPYISQLGICFRMDKYPKNINRYFHKMCQYIGPNLNTLRLKNVPTYRDWLEPLKPLLNRIECLAISTSNYDFEYDIDFQLYCPNLKILKIRMNLNGTLLCKKQPKLEKISILDNQYMEERLVLEFMKNNPQLQYFKIVANDCNNLLQQIPQHLSKLEKLCLYQGYPYMSSNNLEYLTAMKHLKKLKLMYLDEDDFNGILSCLPKFKQLVELKLHLFYDGPDSVDLEETYIPNLDLIVTLAQELPQLEYFHIRYCNIDTDTLTNFIRHAKKLKKLGVYRCELEVTDLILENIENVRQAVNPTLLVLYADKIHPDLNKEKMYNNVKLVTL